MVSLSSLAGPPARNDGKFYFHSDEADFYTSYKYHLEIADLLANTETHHYWDAIYHLNFSVECFLKYAYCLVRKESLGILNATDVHKWLIGWTREKPFKKYLHPSCFSHDLVMLRKFFERETDVADHREWQDLRTELPSNRAWIHDRYKERRNPAMAAKFVKYRKFFDKALKKPFNRIK